MAKAKYDNDLFDHLTKEHFRQIETVFYNNFATGLETTRIDGKTVRNMCSRDCYPEFCRLVKGSATGAGRCKQDRIRSLNISIETGQPYISLCHAGVVVVCVPIMDRDNPLGGMFFGRCLWEPYNDDIEQDILKRLRGLRINRPELIKAAQELPTITGRRIHEAAEFLYILLYQTAQLDPRVANWRRKIAEQQAEINEFIQESKKIGIDNKYPYDSERELIGKVKIGDKTGAREILNSMLGTILIHNPGDLNTLKARMVELLSILSRSAAEGGVDINLLLEKNLHYINTVLSIETQENLCAWISSALNDFIDSVYNAQDRGKMTQIKPAIDFIEAHYDQQITLADIAKAAFLSVSRLAHLFKEEMGITLVDYLTSVRISNAKQLLLATDKSCTQICFEVGYNNQSYFTRTFKEIVGMTPRKFREKNKRPIQLKPPLKPPSRKAAIS